MTAYTKIKESSQRVSWRVTNSIGETITTDTEYPLNGVFHGHYGSNWKYKRARGEGATTAMNGEERTLVVQEGEIGGGWYSSDVRTPANYNELIGRGMFPVTMSYGGSPVGLDTNAAESAAVAQLWSSLVSKRNSMQLGTFVGEINQTVRMLRNCGKSMMSLLTRWNDELRRSKRYTRRMEDARKKAADAHLQFQYGMKPLMSDVNSALSTWTEPRRLMKRAVGVGTSQIMVGSPGYYDNSVGPLNYIRTSKNWESVVVKYGACLRAQVPGYRGVMDRMGLYPEDFVPTVYNLLPWSFLIDYGSNLGNVISAMSFPRSSIAWVWRVTVRETVREYYMSPTSVKSSIPSRRVVFLRNTPAKAKLVRRTVNRNAVSALDLRTPDLQLRIPSAAQGLNMAALYAAKAYQYWP